MLERSVLGARVVPLQTLDLKPLWTKLRPNQPHATLQTVQYGACTRNSLVHSASVQRGNTDGLFLLCTRRSVTFMNHAWTETPSTT